MPPRRLTIQTYFHETTGFNNVVELSTQSSAHANGENSRAFNDVKFPLNFTRRSYLPENTPGF